MSEVSLQMIGAEEYELISIQVDDATKGFRQTIKLSSCYPLQTGKDDFSSRECTELVREHNISDV